MNRNCSACNIMIDKNNYKKDRTVCKTCYNKNKGKNNDKDTLILPTKIHKVNQNNDNNISENRANVVIGPRNVGKTYYMLKILE